MLPSSETDDFGCRTAARRIIRVFLMILTRWPAVHSFQSACLASGSTLFNAAEAIVVVHHQLADQVFHQIEVIPTDVGHRHQVRGAQRECIRSNSEPFFRNLLEKVANGPNSSTALAVQHAGIQVRHGHRRRTYAGQAIHFGQVLVGDLRIGGDQELAADREAAVAVGFWDAGISAAGSGTRRLRR